MANVLIRAGVLASAHCQRKAQQTAPRIIPRRVFTSPIASPPGFVRCALARNIHSRREPGNLSRRRESPAEYPLGSIGGAQFGEEGSMDPGSIRSRLPGGLAA